MANIFDRLRNFLKPTDIYTSQRLMFYVLNFAGFFPLQISGSRYDRKLRISVIGCVWCIVFITFYIVSFTLAITKSGNLLDTVHSSLLSKFAALLKFCNMMGLLILLYGSTILLTKKISRCLQQVCNIDRKLNLIGMDMNYSTGFYLSIFLIACFLTGHFTIMLTLNVHVNYNIIERHPNITISHLQWTTFTTTHMPLIKVTLIECYFVCITFEIRRRFEAMNRMLKYMIEPVSDRHSESIESTTWNIRNNTQMQGLVEDLCNIHNDLCDTCSLAAEYFSIKMMAVFGTGFVCILVNSYYLFLRLFPKEENTTATVDSLELAYLWCQTILVILGIILVGNYGHSITEQNEATSVYVHKIMNSTDIQAIKNKLFEFSLQLMHRKIKFSVFGFFSVDRELLFMMMQGVTTYLLILLEFSNDNEHLT